VAHAAPSIFRQPTNQVVWFGQSAVFEVGATGAPPLSFQWVKDGANINRATNAMLVVSNVQPASWGRYGVAVMEAGGGSVVSTQAWLWVPARILAQPQSQSVPAGGTAQFSVVATGAPPPRYQWFRETTALANATNGTLVISNASAVQGGAYWVRAFNPGGSEDSAPAVLEVGQRPVITVQPRDESAAVGSDVVFHVEAGGTQPLGYHWSFNEMPLPAGAQADQPDLWLRDVQPNFEGNYRVVVSNEFGTALSDPARLTVLTPPSIVNHPQDTAVEEGKPVVLSVDAAGTEPLRYQWHFEGAVIPDATNRMLGFPSVKVSDAGSYFVVVMNDYGATTSAVARITVLTSPRIVNPPQDVTAVEGMPAYFWVEATGSEPLAYQWYFQNNPIAGAKNPMLDLPMVSALDEGNYFVVVSNELGVAISPPAYLTVVFPPRITNQPQDKTVTNGEPAGFSVGVTGTEPLFYQWYHDSTLLPDRTNRVLAFPSVQPGNEGAYHVVVWNNYATVTSATAKLDVIDPPVIITPPQSQTGMIGGTVTFTVSARGGEPLFYRWKFKNDFIADATGPELTISNLWWDDAGFYQVHVSNRDGYEVSEPVALVVEGPPVILAQPHSRFAAPGDSVTFAMAVAGTEPLFYQWYRNGVALTDETNWFLRLDGVQSTDAGNYRLGVSNQFGVVASDPIMLNVVVGQPPSITGQPQNQTAPPGGSVVFSVTATGSEPLIYQWFFEGNVIAGATNDTLRIDNVQLYHQGNYRVAVSNDYGVAWSQSAYLDVALPRLPFEDHFSNSVVIGNMSFIRGEGTNFGATFETNEPIHEFVHANHSMWLSWVAPSNGIVSVSTLGSDFDTVLSVYTGESLPTLTRVASGDDSTAGYDSAVVFNAVAGVVYHFVVAGVFSSEGNIVFELRLKPSATRLPTFLSDLASLAVGLGEDALFRINYEADEQVDLEWIFENTTLPAYLGSTSNHIRSVNEFLVGRYRVVLRTPTETNYSRWADLQINTFARSNVLAHDKFGSLIQSRAYAGENLGTVSPTGGAKKGGSQAKYGAGAHGFSGTQIFSTTGAGSDPGEPNHCGIGAAKSEWYAFQAPSNGFVRIDTDGSSFNTVLAVYIGPGDSYTTLTNIACDDNSGADGLDSKVVFYGTSNTIYWIAVDGRAGASPQTGTVKLNIKLGAMISIGNQPTNQTVPPGTNATFFADANGMTNYVFQWRFYGTNLPGMTSSNLTRTNVSSAHVGPYEFVVSNPFGTITSAVATLALASTVTITSQPQNVTVVAGNNASFSVGASGSGTLTYQWRFNGTNLPGQTSSTLSLLNVQPVNAGPYAVNVTDANGSMLSSNATLTVQVPPAITSQPSSQTFATGSLATLTAAASGTPTPDFRWYFNGALVPGATAATLNITSFHATNEGLYWMTASNFLGTAQSASAEMLANSPLRFTNHVHSNGLFSARLIGVALTNYVIDWSTNNTSWTPHATNSSSSGIWNFTDAWTNWPMRTFRARTP